MEPDIRSDVNFVERAKIRQAREMSPEEKFRCGADLFEESCRWTLAGMAARFPELSESDRLERLRELLDTAE